MKVYDKPRDEASRAVIELRNAVGMNQAEFAIKVLGSAVTTMSRYETTHPPRREQLLKFSAIATEQAELLLKQIEKEKTVPGTHENYERLVRLVNLGNRFHALYLADFLKSYGDDLFAFRGTDRERAYAIVLARAKGPEGVRAAIAFLTLLSALDSNVPKRKARALKLLETLEGAEKDLISQYSGKSDLKATMQLVFGDKYDQRAIDAIKESMQ
jgi:hypothetical protein